MHLHHYLMKCPKNKDIDHINHDALDNRKLNLRIVNRNSNLKNRKRENNNNKIGCRNICYYNGKYIVQLQINGKGKVLGKFLDLADAKIYAKEMRQKYYGEFAGNG